MEEKLDLLIKLGAARRDTRGVRRGRDERADEDGINLRAFEASRPCRAKAYILEAFWVNYGGEK